MTNLRAAVDVPATPEGASLARALVSLTLPRWGLAGVLDDAALVATELYTNALVHTGDVESIEVVLETDGTGLRISVTDDAADARPAVLEQSDERASGRGLQIVQALAHSWGVDSHGPGKRVWARLGDGAAAPAGRRLGAGAGHDADASTEGRNGATPADPPAASPAAPVVRRASGTDRLRAVLRIGADPDPTLDPQDLLLAQLGQLRTALDVDTAAVLLREPGSDHLVARAACGLEEEVRQGVVVPVGAGFAGRVAAGRRPIALDRVDSTTVTNPILWESGITAMLGVPLICDDEVLGVLHIGRREHRPFTAEDTDLLQVAAAHVSSALTSRRLAVETAAAGLLERGLLPPRLPALPGLEFAARYVPAEDRAIGGDWYDAFTLPSGELWLVIGDVAGHGLPAAVVMGRVRSALRSFALLGVAPERAVELTDRKVQHFEVGTMVTMACATSMPPYDRVRICSAGHPPPVVASRGGPGQLVDVPVGPPLGAARHAVRRSVAVDLDPGDVLLLFTDGLVERREVPVHEGLERLRAAVVGDHPETLCRTVMRRMVRNTAPTDDIALVAVGRTQPAVGRQ